MKCYFFHRHVASFRIQPLQVIFIILLYFKLSPVGLNVRIFVLRSIPEPEISYNNIDHYYSYKYHHFTILRDSLLFRDSSILFLTL